VDTSLKKVIHSIKDKKASFQINKDYLAAYLNNLIQEENFDEQLPLQDALYRPSKTGWIPGVLSYPWIFSFLFFLKP